MKKKIVALFLGLLMIVSLGLAVNSNSTNAAAYGTRLFTTPKRLRGTWHLKSGKAGSPNIPRKFWRQYKKIKITTHTITFTRSGKLGLKGRYTLYKIPMQHYSISKMSKVDKYASKHRMLAVGDSTKNRFSFDRSFYWHYEDSRTGGLIRKGNTLTFLNVYCVEKFRK